MNKTWVVGINATKNDLIKALKRRKIPVTVKMRLAELEKAFIEWGVARVFEQDQLKIERNKRRNKRAKCRI
jgi:F0F1-type ATP synthase epsilon subunit